MRGEPQGPCKDCEDRTAENPELGTHDCHGTCEKYKEYRQELAEYKTKMSRARAWENILRRPWMKENSKARQEYRREADHDRKG